MSAEMTIPYLLDRCAFKFPDQEAIVSEAGRWTYRQWQANARRRAAALAKQGIGKGDHVATIFLNGNEVLETFLALMRIGAIIVPLNMRLSAGELKYIIDHSDATTVILSGDFKKVMGEIRSDLPKVKKYIVTGDEVPEGMISFDAICSEDPGDGPDVEIRESDIAFILYTAGTTGKPKGVLLSHKNLVWSALNLALDTEFEPQWILLLVFPLYHSAAIMLVFTTLLLGCTLVTMRTFEPKRVMELMVKERLTKMVFPPTVWNFILQLPGLEQFDTSSVKSISSGAEAMPLETKKKLLSLFPNAKLGETYGMTECAATISTLKPEFSLKKLDSVGQAFANTILRIVGDEGQDVSPGDVGEILIRGPHVMTGYYKDEDATAAALKNGWLYSGDLGIMDQEGFVKIVDRKKDMIVTGAENIYPREIEDVLYTHPKILEVAVIGLPDPEWGERVHAVVVTKEGQDMTAKEVIDYTKDRIASFKKPRSVEFVERLPRSPAGKVLKRVLKETNN